MTGGMGAYSPTPVVSPPASDADRAGHLRAGRGWDAPRGDRIPGVLYAGLMLTPNGPKVLEFNCRFGDPETPAADDAAAKSDLLEVMLAMCEGKAGSDRTEMGSPAGAVRRGTSKGYPGEYPTGIPITGIDRSRRDAGCQSLPQRHKIKTARHSSPTAAACWASRLWATISPTPAAAHTPPCEKIHFDGMHYRKDIGWQALKS